MNNLDEAVKAAMILGRLGYSVLPSVDHDIFNPNPYKVNPHFFKRRSPKKEELRRWFLEERHVDFGILPRKKSKEEVVADFKSNEIFVLAFSTLKSFFNEKRL